MVGTARQMVWSTDGSRAEIIAEATTQNEAACFEHSDAQRAIAAETTPSEPFEGVDLEIAVLFGDDPFEEPPAV